MESLAQFDVALDRLECEVIERVTAVGPASQADALFGQLAAQGYRVVRSGPYTDRQMHPDVDVERFLVVAERRHP